MYLSDPYDLAKGPVLAGEDEEEQDAPPTPAEIFHSQFRHYPDGVGYQHNVAVSYCRFDAEGNHVQMGQHCPHFDAVDEEGPRIVPGWTVQSNRRS